MKYVYHLLKCPTKFIQFLLFLYLGVCVMGKNLTRSTLALAVVGAMSSFAMANETIETTKEKETTQLQTIVVTAAGYEQDVTRAPASMTVITKEELEKRQYSDITDVLRNTPGVVISGAGSAQTVSIRGMGSNYTLFLVNGKRQYSKDVNPNGDDLSLIHI